ncbi:MAG: ABC transporter permease [Ktedonobacteraceae bacterium]|nr:ABC transporter permease [Ktedonobacteraceae bacterium]
MIDLWTMAWKEGKDLFSQGTQAMIRLILLIGILGILLPLSAGNAWVDLPLQAILFLSCYPAFLTFNFVADSFAGERERHTLETLLASRLPDWSIVVGKGIILVALSWGVSLVSMLVSLIVANVILGTQNWRFYAPDRFLATILLGLTTAILSITIGILVSLHVATVRQAQQILTYGVAGLVLVVGFLITQLIHLLPTGVLHDMLDIHAILILAAVIALIDFILVSIAVKRFKRSRLLLL